ncbi:MAG TPA: FeoA family protein [Bacilli bacterium]|nr:FeoA family protein [Bacilli bacterium]HPX84737.1 FeoA family protein [Bacilli bacterium]HQC74459.1 FeoA family protein [Bacilli bacterium]
MTLANAKLNQEYIIKTINTNDVELDQFLLTLGCYSGEPITIVSKLRGAFVVAIKDARYTIDRQLAEAIII